MNPPFSLKRGSEKEYKFVDHALRQMDTGGLLFSILPYPCMVKPGVFKNWRKELLRNNTLLSVITFPDIFYPVGVITVGVWIKKGIPHPHEQNVLWIRAINDGLFKSKGKRLPNLRTPNDLARVKDTLKAFLVSPSLPVQNIEQFQKVCPIDSSDPFLELVPEAYLDSAPPTEEELRAAVENMTREAVAFVIESRIEGQI
jgi:type I restriction enzyme M protein